MLSFFSGILDVISSLISFVVNIVTGMLQLISMIPQGLAFITTSIGYMPSLLAVFALAGISISIVFLIVGR